MDRPRLDPWFALRMGLVVVTGAPGSGKSTLARPLADGLGWSLIEKDVIKEALGDALGEVDRDDQRRLSAASFLAIEALVPRLRDTVIEGNVYPGSPLAMRLAATAGAVEVLCRCPVEVCQERFVGRVDRHRVHSGGSPSLDYLRQFAEPIGLSGLVEVATDRAVAVDDVVRRVRAELDRG
jgi:adenylate kinase family enzyme